MDDLIRTNFEGVWHDHDTDSGYGRPETRRMRPHQLDRLKAAGRNIIAAVKIKITFCTAAPWASSETHEWKRPSSTAWLPLAPWAFS